MAALVESTLVSAAQAFQIKLGVIIRTIDQLRNGSVHDPDSDAAADDNGKFLRIIPQDHYESVFTRHRIGAFEVQVKSM